MIRALSMVLVLAAAGCGGGGQIQDLPLRWAGPTLKKPAPAVATALAAAPLEMGAFEDGRTGDKSVVGVYEDGGFEVRTKGDVRAFWAGRLRVMLEEGGARFTSPADARLDSRLLEFRCVEGNVFHATVRMAFTVTHKDGRTPWTKMYTGESKRWGRTHNAENFEEALSHALADATQRSLQDRELAAALTGAAKPATP